MSLLTDVRESLAQAPRIVEGLIAAAPREALHWREADGTWNSVEVLCHLADGELDQIHFLLGHVSIHTAEHYLGRKQKLRFAVNENRHRTMIAGTDYPSLPDQGGPIDGKTSSVRVADNARLEPAARLGCTLDSF